MPDPAFLKSVIDLGLTGFLLIALWAFATGRVVPRSTLTESKAEDAEDKEEIRKDRDEWKALAQGAVARLDKIADLLETLLRRWVCVVVHAIGVERQ